MEPVRGSRGRAHGGRVGTRVQRQGELDAVMRLMYALSLRDQLEAHRLLSQHLGEELGGETEFARQARERREALGAMERVAERLGLGAGVAPTVTQYREACSGAASEWSSARIIRAWGRYRLAEQAFRGERIPATAAQRSLQRYSSGKAHHYEPPLVGVRQWLGTNPASDTGTDYDDYVREHNSDLVRGKIEGLALIQKGAVRRSLGLPWPDILAVARCEADAAPLQTRYEKERLEADTGPLGLISATTVGLVLGMARQDIARRRDDFPKPVVKVGRLHGWLLADVMAYREGEPFPRRKPGAMQHRVIDVAGLGELLGMASQGVRSAVRSGRPTVLPPDGRLGDAFYWLRKGVEAWLALPAEQRREHAKRLRPPAAPVVRRRDRQVPGFALGEQERRSLGPLLAGLSLGEQVRAVMGTAAWSEVMRPLLEALDEGRSTKGPRPAYGSEELESCLLYKCLAEAGTYAEARALLAGEAAAPERAALGFGTRRARIGRRSLRLAEPDDDGDVPSVATIWRHKQRFGAERHARAYETLFERLAEGFAEGSSEGLREEAGRRRAKGRPSAPERGTRA